MKLRTLVISLSVLALSVTAVPRLASACPQDGATCADPDGPAGAEGPEGHCGPDCPNAPPHPSKEQRAKFKKKMQARFGKMLRGKMQLPDAKAQRVERLVRMTMAKKRPLHQQMRKYHKVLRELLKADSDDQQAFAAALKGLGRTREALRTLHELQITGLQKLLTPKQQAQLLTAHMGMRRDMMRRHMMRGRRDR